MKTQITDGLAEINLSVKIPAAKAALMIEALKGVLALAGQVVRPVNENGDEAYSVEEAFPDGNPGMLIRGLRGKEEMTMKELAERLGIPQTRVSELESGKRSISAAMAKRLAGVFNVTDKMFI
jgi:formylmethanofuran:tetrahydromethanopterin formyltransferase